MHYLRIGSHKVAVYLFEMLKGCPVHAVYYLDGNVNHGADMFV
jgi:hypothetical protein